MIAGAFVLFIIYRLFLNKGIFVRYARRDAAIDLQPGKEEIQDTDFRQLIRHSVSQGDYRKAIRYQYLNVLQQLSAGACDAGIGKDECRLCERGSRGYQAAICRTHADL